MSRTPTPKDAVPSVTKRVQLVEQAVDGLDGAEALSAAEQLVRLAQVQEVLAGVLRGDAVAQLRIPGLG